MNYETTGPGGDQPRGEQTDARLDPVTGVPVATHARAAANVAKLTGMLETEAIQAETPSAVEVAEQADAPVA